MRDAGRRSLAVRGFTGQYSEEWVKFAAVGKPETFEGEEHAIQFV